MEKSINDIWTKGFENSNELSSPKIMNLYNQKSKLLMDKIKKTSETDNKSLLPIAFIFAVGFSIAGHILLGFYGMILIIALFFFNRKLLSSLENIKITSSNYDYLIAYKKAIDKIIESSFKLLGFGLPIIGITGFWLYFRSSNKYAHFINSYSSLHIILIIIALAGIISLAGLSIYKITSHTLYRKHLNDLNMIISDLKNME